MSKRQKERLIDAIMKEIDELGYFSESDVKDVIRYTIQEFEFTEQPK